MKFSIITPTYKRSEKLSRAINSVLSQSYGDWELIIINDSPEDISYDSVISRYKDPRIRYAPNEQNMGVNYSRNKGITMCSSQSEWTIFLDDDDYLSEKALEDLSSLIKKHPEQKWFMTDRRISLEESLTKTPRGEGFYSYMYDYLIMKRIKGDATHCIYRHLLQEKNISFLKTVKQAEEWFFYYQLSLYTKLYYSPLPTTLSDGYEEHSGLNFRKRNFLEELKKLRCITREISEVRITFAICLYLFLRILKSTTYITRV